MTIYIDADACPVTRIAEKIAKDHGIPVTLLCDTNHLLTSDYSTVRTIGAGADAEHWLWERAQRQSIRAACGIRMTT